MDMHALEAVTTALSAAPLYAPALAAAAGAATSFSPCCLGNISLAVALASGVHEPTLGTSFRLSLLYVAGDSLAFAALGAVAALAGTVVTVPRALLYVALGVVMLLMGIQAWGLCEFIPTHRILERRVFQGGAGAFATGLVTGLFASPCCVPTMVTIISATVATGNMAWGIVTMLAYALAHNVLAVAAGTSFGLAQGLLHSERARRFSAHAQTAMGCVIICLSGFMFYLAIA